MAEITNTATIKVVLDADGVEVGLRKIDDGAVKTGRNLDNLGKNSGVNNLGDGAEAAANKFAGGTKTIIEAIQRRTQSMELGKKGTAEYYAALAEAKGVSPAVLKPYLDQLDAVTRKTAQAAEAQRKLDEGANFLQGLQAKADAIGKTASELTAMRAAELGVAEAAAPLIEQLRAAEEAAGDSEEAFSKTEIALAGLAAVASAGAMFGALILEVAEMADDLGDLSTTTGIAVDDLAGLKAAAGKAGSDLEGTAKAINKLSVNIAGNAAEYAKLGVTSKEPLEAFKQFADVFSSIQDPQLKAKLGAEALGESWQTAAPLLSEGGKKIGELVAQGKAAAQMTDDLAQQAGEFNSTLADLNGTVDGFKTKLVSDVLPGLNEVVKALKQAYEESGLLQTAWVGLGALGALTYTDEFSSATVKIANLRKELVRYQQDLELSTNSPYVGFVERLVLGNSTEVLQGKIADIKGQIKQLEDLATSPAKDAAAKAAANAAAAQAKKESDEASAKAAEFLKLDEENRRKAAAAAKAEMDAYRGLTGAINERIDATGREIAGLEPLTESQKLQATLTERLKNGELTLTGAHREAYEQLIKKLAANEAFLVSTKNVAKVHSEYAKFLKEQADLLGKPVVDAKREADANEVLARNFGLTRTAIEELTIARLEDQLAQRSSAALTLDQIEALKAEIAERKRSASALREIDGKESAKKANDEMMADWKNTVEQYDDIFRTGFADMLNNGKDSWGSFTKSLVTTFKTSVADQIYKMFIKPIVVQVVGNLVGGNGGSGIMGMFGSSGGAGAGGGGGNQYVSMAQSAKSAYDAIETGFSSMSSQMGGMVSAVGDFFGSSNVSAFGSGMSMGTGQAGAAANAYNSAGMTSTGSSLNSGATAGSAASVAMAWLAAAQIGRKIGNWISDGYSVRSGSNGNGFVNFTTLQSSVPILGGIVGGLINRAFGRREKEITGSTLNGNFGADGAFAGQTDSTWRQKGGWFKSDKSGTDVMGVNDTSAKEFASAYSSIKMAAADFATTLGINAESIATRTQKLSIAITKDEEATKKAITDFFVGVGNQIALELVPSLGEFTKGTETASETLQRVASEYAFIDAALAAVGDTFGAVGVGSIKAREYLLELSSGMDAFGKDVAYFSQNYLTEAERLAPVAKAVEAAFAELQVAAPKTREEFKALVMGLDLTSANGAKTYAGLMDIQDAFAQLNPAVEAITEKVRTLAEIKIEGADLQNQIDALKMSPADYAEKQRLAARGKIDDSNKPKFDELTGAKAAAALAAINKPFEDQLTAFEKAGMSAYKVRQLETAGMDASTVKLYDLVKAYEASTAAVAAAAQLASVNKGFEDRIYEYEKPGLTAKQIRDRETAGMDESTITLYDKLKGLEAAKAAQEAFDRAEKERIATAQRDQEELVRQQQRLADEAARAAEQMKSAMQSIVDSIFDEVAKIRGMTSGSSAQTLAAAQTEFAIKNAQAQAGNQDAAKLLPSISQKLIELAEANATSLIDLQRIRARTAASLDATGAILAARFGLTLPSLAVGTNYLPADMMIQAHEGERVIPAADNRALMQMINRPAPTDTSSAAQQQASNEMAGLRAEVRSIALSNAALVGMFKRVIKDDKLQMEEV